MDPVRTGRTRDRFGANIYKATPTRTVADGKLFQRSLGILCTFPQKRTVTFQVNTLVSACKSLCNEVQDFYRSHGVPMPELVITSDDLLPLLAYMLVRLPPSHLRHLTTHLDILSATLNESDGMGERGYVLISLQCIVTAALARNYVRRLVR